MHYVDKIDQWVKAHMFSKLENRKFYEIDKLSGGMGAYRTYANKHLTIRVICDRGIYDIEVGPSGQDREMWSVGFVKDYLEPATKGRWNLNLEQSLDFIVSNYSWFVENFTQSQYKDTFKKIDERCKYTFENSAS